jgi:DNA-binding transcriptional LysR family regulator
MNLLEAMRVYVRVVERGGISSAARDLGLGQPAVSERLERLERFLGCRLLLRSTRAFKCTPEGEIFYACSKKVLDAAEDAVAEVSQDRRQMKGTVRIAAPHCLGEGLIPEVIRHVHALHPSLDIDLLLNDRLSDLITVGVDIAFRLGRVGEGSFIACPLGKVPRLLVAAPGYLASAAPIHCADDLSGHPFVRVKGDFDSEVLTLTDPWGQRSVTPIQTSMTTSHWRPMYEMLCAGVGIGVVKVPACIDSLRDARLVPVLPGYDVAPMDLHLLIQARHPFPPRIRAVVDEIRRRVPDILQDRSI